MVKIFVCIWLSLLATGIVYAQHVLDNSTIYVSSAGSDSNSGLDAYSSKLTVQEGVNAAGGKVIVGSGVYVLSSPIAMRPGVTVQCVPGAVITQGNGANLWTLVEFSSRSANVAAIENCDINGNRAGNTDNANVILVYPGSASYVVLRGNTIRNSNGYCVSTYTGNNVKYIDNLVYNCFENGMAVVTGNPFTASHCEIRGNYIYPPMGAHAIVLQNADYCTVTDNHVIGNRIGGATTPLRVSTQGTAVTWVSGPQFGSAITPGNYLIINGGSEFQVASITDATHLQLFSSPGTLINTPAAIGTGDLIDIDSSSYTIFSRNHISTNVTQGISLNTGNGGTVREIAQKNLISDNIVQFIGEMCIGIQQTDGTGFDANVIRGNILQDCGMSGSAAAGGGAILAGILLFGNNIRGTFIDSNYVRDDQGAPTTSYWLALINGARLNSVILGTNTSTGMVNFGILQR